MTDAIKELKEAKAEAYANHELYIEYACEVEELQLEREKLRAQNAKLTKALEEIVISIEEIEKSIEAHPYEPVGSMEGEIEAAREIAQGALR